MRGQRSGRPRRGQRGLGGSAALLVAEPRRRGSGRGARAAGRRGLGQVDAVVGGLPVLPGGPSPKMPERGIAGGVQIERPVPAAQERLSGPGALSGLVWDGLSEVAAAGGCVWAGWGGAP